MRAMIQVAISTWMSDCSSSKMLPTGSRNGRSLGCTYYPWSALQSFPVLQKIVLVNPLVYASEGLRGTLVPQSPHLSLLAVLLMLALFDGLFLAFGLRQFRNKAVS